MRAIFYGLLTLIVAGLALCGVLLVSSRSPEPGAGMVLMGVPMIAAPVAVSGIAVALLAWSSADKLRPAERTVAYLAAGCTVIPFAALAMLG